MKNTKLFTGIITLLILSLALSACDGSVSIEDLQGVGFQDVSPGMEKAIGALDDTQAGQLSGSTESDISTDAESRSADKLVPDSTDSSSSLGEVSLADSSDPNSSGGTYSSSSDELHLYCEVTEVTDKTITLCDETFEVVTTENLTTLFTVGEFYEIEYLVNEDGSITILEFELEDDMDDDMDDSSDDSYDNSDDDYDDNDDDSNNDSYNDNNDNNNDDDYNNNNNNNSENNS